MEKYFIILFIVLFGCKEEKPSDISSNVSSEVFTSKNTSTVEKQTPQTADINQLYREVIKELKAIGYSSERTLKKSRYKFNQFKSNDKISYDGIRLKNNDVWVDVVKYSYESPNEISIVAENIKSSKQLDMIFKEYSSLHKTGNYLLLFKSGCNNTSENWSEIKSAISKVDIEEIVSCRCGGYCE